MLSRSVFCSLDGPNSKVGHRVDTYRLLSSSSLMMHAAPVLLHWAHSDSPSFTTHLILLSRQEAQAIEARWRTCCLLLERADGAGLDECSSEPALSVSPSERDLRLPPENAAAAMIAGDVGQTCLAVSRTSDSWRSVLCF